MIFTLDILLQMVKRPFLVIYELYSSNYWKSDLRENLYTSIFERNQSCKLKGKHFMNKYKD